jgi:hypothetical protein
MALDLLSDNRWAFRPAPFRVEIFRPDSRAREAGRGRKRRQPLRSIERESHAPAWSRARRIAALSSPPNTNRSATQ